MIHKEQSPLAGKNIIIKKEANQLGGREILIEDYWDRISDKPWGMCNGNPACMIYAMRTGFSKNIPVPTNNEVLYGKIDGSGYLVNEIELEQK